MLKIGDFSALAQVSIMTLRYYDEAELLKPEWVDPESGYRYYAARQVARLHRILALKDFGNGYQMAGPARELYLHCTQPIRQDDESYVTEIQVPVKKAA